MTYDFLLTGLVPLHVLHHAVEGDIYGQAMLEELRRHGYRIGPGTLYPMLHRLEERGYLKAREVRNGKSMRRYYRATAKGRKALDAVKPQIGELFGELIGQDATRRGASAKKR
ncbi:PadR family transcriptional regulator [Aerosticca soli]|jgi:DNA-binding PadR family transcriptional regulator|uniref:Transcriptional regulator, PadR family n=1 Tax=Aerosticca soli TaxID=2010829 RepID=A0A2Z6E1T6_9GAMM|nr:PadR family transcriptional regulator [Aerosticca soli]BBD78952.1 transcriptional regulator, PadR family [Aerosticca soli]